MVEAMEIQKGFKKTEVGVIPNDWKLLPVSKFGEVKRGAGSQYIKYVNYNGIRFIRINDFFEDSPVYVSPTVDMMRFAITESDVLFAGTGASAGASYIPKKEWIGLPHSYNAPRIRTNENHSKEFLLHTLQSEYIAKQQRAWFVGAAQPFLDLNAISNFLIATPPTKAEQAAIAEALNDADALITELEKLIAKKKAIKQGAMQELLKPKEGWEVKKLGEIADIDKGEQLNRETLSDRDTYPVFNGGISPSGYTNKWNTEKGTIIISEGGNSCGYINFIKERFWRGGHCYQVKTRIEKEFLFHILKSQEKNIMALRVGSGLPNIQRGRLIGFELIIPKDENEQKKIAQILSDMDTEIEALEKKLDKYKMLKQGMMQNLLTGKIRLI